MKGTEIVDSRCELFAENCANAAQVNTNTKRNSIPSSFINHLLKNLHTLKFYIDFHAEYRAAGLRLRTSACNVPQFVNEAVENSPKSE